MNIDQRRQLFLARERLNFVYQYCILAAAVSLVLVMVLVIVLRNDVPRTSLVGWGAFMLVNFIARIFLGQAYRRLHTIPGDRLLHWRFYYVAVLVMAAVGWGYAAGMFYLQGETSSQVLFALIVAGVLAATVSYLPAIPYLYPVFLFICGTPFVSSLLMEGTDTAYRVAILMGLFMAMILLVARHTGRVIDSNLCLKFDNGNLVKNLQQANTELEEALMQQIDIEQALRTSEERLRDFADASFEGMLIHHQGDILDANKALVKMLETTEQELMARQVADIFAPECVARIKKQIARPEDNVIEAVILNKHGLRIDIELLGRDIFYRGLHARVMALRDVSLHRKQEQELHEAVRTAQASERVKTNFLSVMSHELRTPLNSVKGFNQLLAQTELSNEQRQYLAFIDSAAQNLVEMISNAIDFVELDEIKQLHTMPVKICDNLEELVDAHSKQANRYNLPIKLHCQDIPSLLMVDSARLRQILDNLLSNAIKFTHKGEINISVHCEREDDACAWLRFEVRDTGIGLSPERLDRLFDRFSKNDEGPSEKLYQGIGLGLAICQRLVGMMGGEISAESRPGEGARFSFVLPLAKARQATGRS